ncbi:MAG: hypothetical protein A3C08_00805 [Candidatus Taylorbacteria bacterium RIFCSPHIGHO2_02_FULL_47_18]|uniref:Uncharacterized protein n=1 Tax=Candidatus Taylorbacteria bacterium RIFCSPLOWO2_01_FULL_48_100 TaxID=1802322 RepID=A0A1G2NGV0_9BACT|nr:MAG: hypothetical protein A2670_00480 [Candidatus Taylorbacteria bacterium RIFCSPHIGHO2_01_FULL_48_38]OHA27509.1 MAG: hypothetical protein A3C08_00805 [Candidatus Taylorbacteria bacterium RIFCSPHIGHO2_02_FULL_47_18]OHA34572.1 MAG: hypothetical protein A2938_03425 [Candidatus Taylorbacteria bacterium RIFCSPLOWO2_01_FULL_48_100]OHA40336.1 MAG: hypothetical protein A3J31_01900 [Candidatus Taylorbacteria bacterium RIFCSPLOWO2_02_FULL_48_16]OHA44994.1 MAG: hypothetical protein A3H13_03735 [Candid
MKKKRLHCRRNGRFVKITEAMIHRAFHALALAECRKWEREVGTNTHIRGLVGGRFFCPLFALS